ncbi:MAG: hypothetical protein HY562_11920 [Ignavibacteriales bacterium]|nr:hypothetical protein [Ignavibacteriales bacterium]
MIQFIFKVGDQSVELANVVDPSLRNSFEQLKSRLELPLESIACIAHELG